MHHFISICKLSLQFFVCFFSVLFLVSLVAAVDLGTQRVGQTSAALGGWSRARDDIALKIIWLRSAQKQPNACCARIVLLTGASEVKVEQSLCRSAESLTETTSLRSSRLFWKEKFGDLILAVQRSLFFFRLPRCHCRSCCKSWELCSIHRFFRSCVNSSPAASSLTGGKFLTLTRFISCVLFGVKQACGNNERLETPLKN